MNNRASRCLGLDLLRLLAVLLVLFRHLYFPADGGYDFLRKLCQVGWVGVDIFFVLSGFLVSGLLFREYQVKSKIDIKVFLIRRGFKIYPSFWVFLIFTIFMAAIRNDVLSARSITGELLFLQNYGSGLWNHTWSLAVEEHFYLFVSIWVLFLTGAKGFMNFRSVLVSFLLVAFGCLIFRIWTDVYHQGFSFKKNIFPTHLRIDSLMYGVFLSYVYNFHPEKLRGRYLPSWLLALLACAFLSPVFLCEIEKSPFLYTYGFSIIYFGAGFMCLLSMRLVNSKSAFLNVCGILGSYSYSIYLWHMPINQALVKLIGLDDHKKYCAYVLLYFLISIVLGSTASRLIEVPFLKMRSRFLGLL